MKIVLSHPLFENSMQLLAGGGEVTVLQSSDLDSEMERVVDADALLVRIGQVSRELIEQCGHLKVVARTGVGVDNIDVDCCTQQGIPVVICPGTNARSVAEHAVALAYGIGKNLVESHNECAKGNFAIRGKYASFEMENSQVGIVGFGEIGKITAALFSGNGATINVYDPYVKKEAVEALGYCYHAALPDLLECCRVVSLHLPSLPETRHLFNRGLLAGMRDGAFLINCARGDIIEEHALYDALSSGKLGGAAADVMAAEPFDPQHPLFALPNFIATPHMAGLTQEAAERTFLVSAQGILDVLNGKRIPNVANPQVYNHPNWN